MIFAKINPVASKVIQVNPFSATTVTADTMTAIARPYILGAKNTRFEVLFGTITTGTTVNDVSTFNFNQVMNTELTLNSNQLVNWGDDDSVVLRLIAGTYNTRIDSIFTGQTNMF